MSKKEKKFQTYASYSRIPRGKKDLAWYEENYLKLLQENDELRTDLRYYKEHYDVISNATLWKITKPIRAVSDFCKSTLRRIPPVRWTVKLLRSVKKHGVKVTLHKVKMHLKEYKANRKKGSLHEITPEQRAQETATVFDRDVTFSILVPLYNTPSSFLREMVASVVGQTYPKWELCLADGSDAKHPEVEATVRELMAEEPRIKYVKLEKNLGISENTNACIELATGNYIALFDHDDILHPSALYRMMQEICEKDADMLYTDEATFLSPKLRKIINFHYKPDYSPDLLRGYNYICHFTAFSQELLEEVGGVFRKEYDGSQDYDMILRLTEKAKNIVHIPDILYFWRAHSKSVAAGVDAKPYTTSAARRALRAHLERSGLKGDVHNAEVPSTYRVIYDIEDDPLVSILIPNMDHIDVLTKCVDSVESLSTYSNYEIIIIENNSKNQETFACYERLCSKYSNVRVVKWEHEFNYSKINNFGAEYAKGEYYILLNNDIEIITPEWIEEMLMFVQRDEVGAAGMMLYYPDDTVQHAGVILGIGGVAGHSHKYFPRGDSGYMSRMGLAQDLSAVTAASMMIKASVYREIGGLDPSFAVAFNDVDLCMKIRQAGYLIVFTPFAEAYHYESKSRGLEDTPEKVERFNGEVAKFHAKWGDVLAKGDPYYNPHLTLVHEDFSFI